MALRGTLEVSEGLRKAVVSLDCELMFECSYIC